MNNLLDLAISAHGGNPRWAEIETIDLTASITGTLSDLKGYPDGLRDIRIKADVTKPFVTFAPFPAPGTTGTFKSDRVVISSDAGGMIEERIDPRLSFAGHSVETRWDQLQRMYFFGYAMWNYLTTPFILTQPDFLVREIEPHEENDEIWRRLAVTFPPNFPTHCREQVFYFSETGLLQRVDYVTDIVGGVAAHYCFDHRNFNGIVIPTRRRVVTRRSNSHADLSGPSRVFLEFWNVSLS